VSYLEIYNENGFDLLDPNKEVSRLEDLPRVSLMEDADGMVRDCACV
jgi:kinesin family member 6/9